MDKDLNITKKQKYVSKFDQELYNQFKKIAKENNKSQHLMIRKKK